MITTKRVIGKICSNEDCVKVPCTEPSCFAAELLSEVSFISAESLILLLERLSLIEAQLQTISQLEIGKDPLGTPTKEVLISPLITFFPKWGVKAL